VAGAKTRQTQTSGSDPLAFESSAGSADIAENQAWLGSVSTGRQSSRLSHPVAPVIAQPSTAIQPERKFHEAHTSLSKPNALSPGHSTKTCSPNPPGEAEFHLPSDAFRSETKNQIA
jgi:hypothetical protein